MRGCITVLFFLVPLLAGGIGFLVAHDERRTIARMVPVEAEILATGVRERQSTRTGRQWEVFYTPRPHFAYHVDGERYTSRLYALRSSEYVTRASAEQRLAPYAAGGTATAFYDPENPAVAVLNRGVSALPYLGILFGAGMLAAGPLAWTRANRKAPSPPRRAGRHYRLESAVPTGAQLHGGLLSLGIWTALTAAVLVYFLQGPSAFVPMGVYEIAGFLLYGGVGLAGGHQAWEGYRRGRTHGEAVIWLKRDHLVIGADNPVLYEQTVHRSDTVRKVTVGAKLFEVTAAKDAAGKWKTHRDVAHEAQVVLGEQIPVLPGERLRLEGRVPIPSGLPPASPAAKQVFPRNEWAIEVRLEGEQGGTYEARYPITAAEATPPHGGPSA